MPDTVTDLFRNAASTYPGNAAFFYYRENWQEVTYADFSADVLALSSYLLKTGAARNDRIAIMAENRPEWCAAYLAILAAGCVAVPLDAQLGADEVNTLLLDAEARTVFHSTRTADMLNLYVGNFRTLNNKEPRLIDFDGAEYQEIRTTATADVFPACSAEDTASLIYTSGTTGNPKGVLLSHRNFCSDAQSVVDARIVSHDDNVLSVLPLHHTYAFMCTFLVPICIGATITYPQSMKGPDMISAIQGKGVSIVIGVPQLLSLMRNSIISKLRALPKPLAYGMAKLHAFSGLVRRNLSINIGRLFFASVHRKFGPRFRFFTCGGAKLDPDVMRDLEALGLTVLEGYGLTETAPVVTFNPIEKRKPGSAGRPLPSVSIRIADPSEAGEGEIEIKGPMVMQGYYRNPSATADVLHDGWFRTGDIGRLDPEEYLFITGRLKEVIVLSSGKNIYPEEVEKMYLVSRLIREICVTGIEHQGMTESLHAVIVPDFEYAKQAGISNLNETIKWEINEVSGKLPTYMRITGFSLTSEPLPRTPLGKLRRFKIKAALTKPAQEKRERTEGDETEFGDEIGQSVLQAIRETSKAEKVVHAEDNLELDLGLDSLSKIELVVALERSLSTKLQEDFMSDVHTVKELADKLRKAVRQEPGERKTAKAGWKAIIAADPAEKIILESRESLMIPSRIMHALLRCITRIMFRLEAKNIGNIPRAGSFILAPNHTSYLDGFVVVLSLPFVFFKDLYSLGMSDFFTGTFKGWFAKIGHVIPIDASSYLNHALQTSAYVLRNGRAICVYPEGGRSPDGSLLEFKKGVGIIAAEMGVPVVPVYIKGAFEALPRTAVLPRPAKISVIFGTPLSAKDVDFSKRPADMDEYQYFASLIRQRVRELSLSA